MSHHSISAIFVHTQWQLHAAASVPRNYWNQPSSTAVLWWCPPLEILMVKIQGKSMNIWWYMVIQQWMKISILFSNKNHEENGYRPFSWVFDGLVWGKIYRTPWLYPTTIRFSCKFPHDPLSQNQRGQYVWEHWEPHKYQKQHGFLIDVSDFEDPGTGR